MNYLPANVEIWQQTLQWQPTEQTQRLFQALYEQILAGNRQLNLTRLTTVDDFWEKHLWDSLSGIAPWLMPEKPDWAKSVEVEKVVDIGTGGGFPGIPVAIANPTWNLTLVDSTRKKIQFLSTLCASLQLPQVACLAERVEALGQASAHRSQYDLALIRAVGSAATCAEYAIPLLKIGGIAVLFRGQWQAADTEALQPALTTLGSQLLQLRSWSTPLTQGVRHCLYLQKMTATDNQYPRAVGIPAKEPL